MRHVHMLQTRPHTVHNHRLDLDPCACPCAPLSMIIATLSRTPSLSHASAFSASAATSRPRVLPLAVCISSFLVQVEREAGMLVAATCEDWPLIRVSRPSHQSIPRTADELFLPATTDMGHQSCTKSVRNLKRWPILPASIHDVPASCGVRPIASRIAGPCSARLCCANRRQQRSGPCTKAGHVVSGLGRNFLMHKNFLVNEGFPQLHMPFSFETSAGWENLHVDG